MLPTGIRPGAGSAPCGRRLSWIWVQAGAGLEVPVPGYAENRRPRPGVNFIDDEGVLLEPFTPVAPGDGTAHRYRLDFEPPWAGALRYEIRALPDHPHLTHPYELGLMRRL